MATAIIAGASGLVGGHCLKALLLDDYYSGVLAFLRTPLTCQNPKPVVTRAMVHVAKGNFLGVHRYQSDMIASLGRVNGERELQGGGQWC